MSLLPNQGKAVLWIRKPEALELPAVLLSAAPWASFAPWRKANPWADSIPLIAFGGDEMRVRRGAAWGAWLGRPFQLGTDDGVPWRAENAPPAAWEGFTAEVPGVTLEPAMGAHMRNWIDFMRRCVRHAPPGPIWELGAEVSDGMCALAAAMERGRAVALAPGYPGILAASEYSARGVSIEQRDASGDGRRRA